MCGIVGRYNFDKKLIDREELIKMRESLIHRGPDASGIEVKQHIGFAHRRLSVIAPESAANQPMMSEDQNQMLIYNGTIYNFKELDQEFFKGDENSDTRLLFKLLKEIKEKALDKIEGMYAFAFYDKQEEQLILSRDPVGIKPLYYYLDDNKLIFASEIKAILCDQSIDRTISKNAINQYFNFGYIASPLTPFSSIKQLRPGESLIIKNGEVSFQQLDLFDQYLSQRNISLKKEFAQQFEKTVQAHTIADVDFTSFLSGGTDSSAIALALNNINQNKKLTTFQFKDPNFDESPDALEVAKKLKRECEVIKEEALSLDMLRKIALHNDDLICDPSLIPSYQLFAGTAKHFKMALSADGGDEIFWGYHTHQASLATKSINKFMALFIKPWLVLIDLALPFTHKRYTLKDNLYRLKEGLSFNFPDRHLNWRRILFIKQKKLLYSDSMRKYVERNSMSEKPKSINFKDQISYLDFRYYLSDNLLKKVDRMSMGHGLEVRVPFLTKSFLKYILAVPYKERFQGAHSKKLLKDFLNSKTGLLNPNKKKSGFSPDLKEFIESEEVQKELHGVDQNHELFNYINYQNYKRFLVNKNIHRENHYAFYALLNFKFWLDIYGSGNVAKNT